MESFVASIRRLLFGSMSEYLWEIQMLWNTTDSLVPTCSHMLNVWWHLTIITLDATILFDRFAIFKLECVRVVVENLFLCYCVFLCRLCEHYFPEQDVIGIHLGHRKVGWKTFDTVNKCFCDHFIEERGMLHQLIL